MHISMAEHLTALAVAAVLQYLVILVACRMLLIPRKKRRRKYRVKPWLTTRTVHGAYHSLFKFNDLLSTDSLTFKNFMGMDFPAFEDLLSRITVAIKHRSKFPLSDILV